jgi:hypothetical protein
MCGKRFKIAGQYFHGVTGHFTKLEKFGLWAEIPKQALLKRKKEQASYSLQFLNLSFGYRLSTERKYVYLLEFKSL